MINWVTRGVNATAAAEKTVVVVASWKDLYVIALDSYSLLSWARRAKDMLGRGTNVILRIR